jgi:hypothetical protein
METKIYICGYTQCLHGGEVNSDEAIKHGNRFYHKDCLKQVENKQKIRQLYLEKVNPTEVVKNLNRVINNLIDIKKIDGEFLYYAINYCVNNNISINTPYGLYYIINNKNIKNSYVDLNKQQKLYGNYVLLTDEEYFSLLETMSEKELLHYIDRLNNYIESTGKQYKSYYYTILSWFDKNQKVETTETNVIIHSS